MAEKGFGRLMKPEGDRIMGLFTPDINRLAKNNRVSELLRCLNHKNPGVRYSAFTALSKRTDLSEEIRTRLKNVMHDDPDPWMRTTATLRYADLSDHSVAENLIKIIKEGSLKSKLALLRQIENNGQTSDVTILQIIIIGLTDEKVLVRLQAIMAANSSKNPQLIQHLGDRLGEKHARGRLFAAKALYNIGREESLRYLIKLLADKNTEVHSAARTYITAIITETTRRAVLESAIGTPLEPINPDLPESEQPFRVRRDALIREALEILYRGCRDRYRAVRIEALKSIAIFRDRSSFEMLEMMLKDRFPEVRIEAINTLEKLGGKQAIDAIDSVRHDRKRHVRDAAERALARLTKIYL